MVRRWDSLINKFYLRVYKGPDCRGMQIAAQYEHLRLKCDQTSTELYNDKRSRFLEFTSHACHSRARSPEFDQKL
jgi:hypothetical protein